MNTSFIKSGYRFTYTPGPGAFGRISTYTIHADPITRGSSGQHSFFTNEDTVIRANSNGPAGPDSSSAY